MLVQRGGRILSILGVCSSLAALGGIVMLRSSPQHKQFSGQLGFLVFVFGVCLC